MASTGLTMRGEVGNGRIRVCTVDEEGRQLLIFELDDSGLLRVLIADLVDGQWDPRFCATASTLEGPCPFPPPPDLLEEAA